MSYFSKNKSLIVLFMCAGVSVICSAMSVIGIGRPYTIIIAFALCLGMPMLTVAVNLE